MNKIALVYVYQVKWRINVFGNMITYRFKFLLILCITVAALILIIQNDWNSLIREPKRIVSQIPIMMTSNSFLNNIFGVLNTRTLSPPSTNLKTRIKSMINEKSKHQMRKLYEQNSLYYLISYYDFTQFRIYILFLN